MKKQITAFLSIIAFCFADFEETPTHVESDISSVVEGVNVITGAYSFTAPIHAVQGAQPLVFYEAFNSQSSIFFRTPLWTKSHFTAFEIGKKKIDKVKHHRAFYVEDGGASMCLTEPYKKQDLQLKLAHTYSPNRGITNTARGPLSAATNLSNLVLEIGDRYDHKACVTKSDGTVQYFQKYDMFYGDGGEKDPHYLFRLEDQIYPSGNRVHFHYKEPLFSDNSFTYPQRITFTSADKETVFFEEVIKKTSWSKKTDLKYFHAFSDGHIIEQGYKRHRICIKEDSNTYRSIVFYLEWTDSTLGPKEYYDYHFRGSKKPAQLLKRSKGDDRYTALEYYKKGKNEVGNFSKKDPRVGRVKHIKGPAGTTNEPVSLYSFVYQTCLDEESKVRSQGTTVVTDGNGNKKRYVYDGNQRLSKIDHLGKEQQGFYRREYFSWSEDGKLLYRQLNDQLGCLRYKSFEYDSKGNVVKESVFGTTSQAYQNFRLINEKPPEGIESQSVYYTYSDDRFHNLLTKETDDLLMRCRYVENSSLLQSKIITDKQNIYLRTFYVYDANGVVIEEITDDGHEEEKEDLAGITQRLIKRITPKTEGVGIGLPLVEECYGYDTENGCEKLITKTVNTYNNFYKLCKQEVFDSGNQFAYQKEWVYDKAGLLIEEVDALAQRTIYRYDANHNRIYQLSPGGQKETFYTYDFMNRLIHKEIRDPEGGRFSTTYCYDVMGNLIKEFDHYGNATSYLYDGHKRCIQITKPAVNGSHPIIQKEYDPFDNVISQTDPEGNAIFTHYNAFNQPVCTTYPDGSEEKRVYYNNGTLAEKIERNGLKTCYTYDALRRVIEEKQFDQQGQQLSVKTQSYSAFHLLSSTDAMDLTTIYTYDHAGRLIKEQMDEKEVRKSYDSLGRLSTETIDDGTQTRTTHFTYDLNNRMIETWQEEGEHWEGKTYDAENRIIAISRATTQGRQSTLMTYDGLDRTTSLTFSNGDFFYTLYDASKPEKRVFYPDGKQVHTSFDALGRITCIEKRNVHGVTTYHKQLDYDLNGNLIKEQYTVYAPNQRSREVTNLFSYDGCGQLIDQIEGYGDFNQRLSSFSYVCGQKSLCTKPDGTQLFYVYDVLGRLIHESSSDGTIDAHWEYNARGQPVRIQDKQGTTVRRYDLYGRLTEEILANGLCCRYAYDLADRLVSLSYPDGTQARYNYGPTALEEVCYQDARIQYNYHSCGQLENSLLANGDTLHYAYDDRQRLLSMQSELWNQTEITYDSMGNIVHMVLNGEPFDFSYDDGYQIAAEKGHSYVHDSLCNRLQEDEETFIYDALNQLLATDCSYDANGNLICYKETSYTYDAHDQLLSVRSPEFYEEYTYDSFHRRLSNGKQLYAYYDNHELGAFTKEGTCFEKRIIDPSPQRDSALLLELDGAIYTPYHDHRGNVCALAAEHIVESYRYSAFGQEGNISSRNPYRLFGKRNDPSGLIYFGYRYYHPTLGRYLTADPIGFADGANRYAYCANNPLSKIDLYGLSARSANFSFSLDLSSDNLFSFDFSCSNFSFSFNYSNLARWCIPFETLAGGLKSFIFDMELPRATDIGIGFINGINNTFNEFFKSIQYLSLLAAGYNIVGVYNATHGPDWDLLECGIGLLKLPTEPVRQLQKMWDQFFETASPDAKFLMICHSQGAIHTANALKSYSPELRKRILVVAIAPGGYIDPKTCGKVLHYRAHAWRDFIPYIDVEGQCWAWNTIHELGSHPDAPLHDHSFVSPTYEDSLRKHIQNYLKSGGGKL